ncbi:trehalose-phosphatase-domain-containing protein [Colletotrichum cereale]|nr:trehalose-phosphatase-domain-containing protein [Colletotrichum cereale]
MPEDSAYKVAEKLADELQAAAKANHWDMVVVQGAKVVEVKSRFLDKGEIVRTILQQSPGHIDFVLNMGDDTADEHMFAAVAAFRDSDDDYTMWVQNKQDKATEAKWRIPGPEDAWQSRVPGLRNKANAWNSPPGLLKMLASLTKRIETGELN